MWARHLWERLRYLFTIMRYPTPNSRHWKVAAKAIRDRLAEEKAPVLMFSLTSVADQAARDAGRKSEMFPSLFDYTSLLPDSWTTAWLGQGGGGDSLYYATPRGWTQGPVAPSLTAGLMGPGPVRVVDAPCS